MWTKTEQRHLSFKVFQKYCSRTICRALHAHCHDRGWSPKGNPMQRSADISSSTFPVPRSLPDVGWTGASRTRTTSTNHYKSPATSQQLPTVHVSIPQSRLHCHHKQTVNLISIVVLLLLCCMQVGAKKHNNMATRFWNKRWNLFFLSMVMPVFLPITLKASHYFCQWCIWYTNTDVNK